MANIQLGMACSFAPTAFIDVASGRSTKQKKVPRRVTGRVTYINRALMPSARFLQPFRKAVSRALWRHWAPSSAKG